MPTVNDVSELFGITKQTARDWAGKYANHLSPGANPGKGKARYFTEQDLRVFALVDQMRAKSSADDILASLAGTGPAELPPLPTEPEAARTGTQLARLPDDESQAEAEATMIDQLERIQERAIAPYKAQIADLKEDRDYWRSRAVNLDVDLETERSDHVKLKIEAARLETELQVYKDLAKREEPAEGQIGATEGQIEPTGSSQGLIAWLRRRLSGGAE